MHVCMCVCVRVGHSMCNLETAVKAVNNGASFVTHLFNAMLPVSVYCVRCTVCTHCCVVGLHMCWLVECKYLLAWVHMFAVYARMFDT